MDSKRALIGSIITVAIFAVVYTYFMATIQATIGGDLATWLAMLPVTLTTTAVILGVVGLIAGLIGGVVATRENLIGVLIFTAVFSILVAVGNFVYQAGLINVILSGGITPEALANVLQNYLTVSLSTYGAGIVGMVAGNIIGGLAKSSE
ncbi:MAG: hypothetical protein ACW976_03610 [Candidatus Ranarchaeia archaeon]|jgi:uncharacterized membrane protein